MKICNKTGENLSRILGIDLWKFVAPRRVSYTGVIVFIYFLNVYVHVRFAGSDGMRWIFFNEKIDGVEESWYTSFISSIRQSSFNSTP